MDSAYKMLNDFFDGFSVSVSSRECILAGQRYPLGTFATEFLELDRSPLLELPQRVAAFREEFAVFLSARDPSSAATAQRALNEIWDILEQLPVYKQLSWPGGKAEGLLCYMRAHPDEVDDMLTPGTDRNRMMDRWLERLENFSRSIDTFVRDTTWMLLRYFEDLPARKAEDYARAYRQYRQEIEGEYELVMEEREEDDSIPEPELARSSFPVQISFVAEFDDTGKCVLVEQLEFEELASFLHYDLCRGMAVGNLPRRCDCCGHYFLAIGGYDTCYCSRVAPGETVRTCRQVGAHRKEKQKNGTVFAQREYQRVYNRLKGRKHRGAISVDEWNQQVAMAQELKEQAIQGEISDAELKRRFDEI